MGHVNKFEHVISAHLKSFISIYFYLLKCNNVSNIV